MKNVYGEAFVRYLLIIVVTIGGVFLLGMLVWLGAWIAGNEYMAEDIAYKLGCVLGLGLWFWLGLYVTALGMRAHQAKNELSKLIAWAEKKVINMSLQILGH